MVTGTTRNYSIALEDVRRVIDLKPGHRVIGVSLCLARGLGEFGATIMFAGSLQGKTQTLPLAVYTQFEAQGGLTIALAISSLLVVISLAILLSLKVTSLWQHSRQSSLSPFGRSRSV